MLIDITSQSFNGIQVLQRAGRDSTGKTTWKCRCHCGREMEATGLNLKNGNTKSCGCMRHRKGADNPRTITDPARLLEKSRSYAAYRNWRKDVLSRTTGCIRCQAVGELQAHHLQGYAEHPAGRYQSANGVAMCGACHRAYHARHGRKTGFGPDSFAGWLGGLHEAPPTDAERFALDEVQQNVVKYVSRHKAKNGAADIRKAIHYLELILKLQYGEDA